MSQEDPAVYSIGLAGALYSYTGSKPFSKDALYKFPSVGGPPWVPGIFNATESWAAFVIDEGAKFGLGIYNPSTTSFIAGFHGIPGRGTSSDDNTGYMAPLGTEILTADIVYTYDCWLILGNLQDIRNYVYEKRQELIKAGEIVL